MTKDYESDGRTKLLSSRPEQDNYVGKTLVLALFPATARWCRGRKWSVAESFDTSMLQCLEMISQYRSIPYKLTCEIRISNPSRHLFRSFCVERSADVCGCGIHTTIQKSYHYRIPKKVYFCHR